MIKDYQKETGDPHRDGGGQSRSGEVRGHASDSGAGDRRRIAAEKALTRNEVQHQDARWSKVASPNWRRFVHAFCLCNLPIELQGPFRTKPGNRRLRRTAWWGWEDSNF